MLRWIVRLGHMQARQTGRHRLHAQRGEDQKREAR